MRPHTPYVLLVLVPLALVALLPSTEWHRRGPLPRVPTHQPTAAHVSYCQRYAAGWNPERSNPTLEHWARCMRIRP